MAAVGAAGAPAMYETAPLKKFILAPQRQGADSCSRNLERNLGSNEDWTPAAGQAGEPPTKVALRRLNVQHVYRPCPLLRCPVGVNSSVELRVERLDRLNGLGGERLCDRRIKKNAINSVSSVDRHLKSCIFIEKTALGLAVFA